MTREELIEALRSEAEDMGLSKDGCPASLYEQAADMLEAEGWRDMSEFSFEVGSLGVGERMLFMVPPYGISTGHFNGDKMSYHSILNRDAEATHFKRVTPPNTGEK